jgi:hypothetical protein
MISGIAKSSILKASTVGVIIAEIMKIKRIIIFLFLE